MVRYTLHMHSEAMSSLYQIKKVEGGDVSAEVGAALQALRIEPKPRIAEPHEDRLNRFRLIISNHIVDYQVDDAKEEILILFIS